MPTNGQYKLSVKYEKLGHDRSRQGEPSKACHPIRTWGFFGGSRVDKGYCGCLVEGVIFDYSDTAQCGLSIAILAKIEEVS